MRCRCSVKSVRVTAGFGGGRVLTIRRPSHSSKPSQMSEHAPHSTWAMRIASIPHSPDEAGIFSALAAIMR